MIKAEPSWTLRGPAVRNVPVHGLLLLRAGDNPIIHERAGTFLTVWNKDGNISALQTDEGRSVAWTLDKYKNIHIVEKLWELEHDMDWYFLIDADTYVIWSNLIRWLPSLDVSKKAFYGANMFISSKRFTHGGSGTVLPKASVYDFVVTHKGTASRWEARTQYECCGDYMLDTALLEYGNVLTDIYPSISGQKPVITPYSYSEAYWCQPTVTMHHFNASEMTDFDGFERSRLNQTVSIHHS